MLFNSEANYHPAVQAPQKCANAYKSLHSGTIGTRKMVWDVVLLYLWEVSPAPGVFKQTGPGLWFKPDAVLAEPDQYHCLEWLHRLQCFIERPFGSWRAHDAVSIWISRILPDKEDFHCDTCFPPPGLGCDELWVFSWWIDQITWKRRLHHCCASWFLNGVWHSWSWYTVDKNISQWNSWYLFWMVSELFNWAMWHIMTQYRQTKL